MEHDLLEKYTVIINDVLNENARQDKKWGADRVQHPFLWNTILMEEVGEVAETSLDLERDSIQQNGDNYRAELIQVAAVAFQALLCHDRNFNL